MNREGPLSQSNNHMKDSIVLPCELDHFREFISGLLGKPQTISKRFRGAFDINAANIEDLHSLICQRISQQNKASLIQFTARIVFDDDSSVLLNSIDEFMTYREIRPVTSTQLHLAWSFLVVFQDKQAPEKQEIQVSFVSSFGPIPVYDEDMPVIHGRFVFSVGIGASMINFRIHHTARTWGADIEALLTGHIRNIIVLPPKLRRWVWRHSTGISLTVAFLFFGTAVFFSFWTASQVWSGLALDVTDYLGDSVQLQEKLDYVLTTVSSGLWARYYFSVFVFLTISLILSIVFGNWVDATAGHGKPSFIVLTEQAERRKQKLLRRYQKKLFSFILSLIVGLLTGVTANWLFHYFWKAG